MGVFLVLFKKNFNVDFLKVIVEIEIKVIVVFCCVSLYEIVCVFKEDVMLDIGDIGL